MLKPFPYKDSHRAPWKYDLTLISTQIGKEEVCSNISSGLPGLTKSGRCYTFEELEKKRNEIGKSAIEPVKNRVTTKEVKEFLKTIWKADYSVIQQLKESPAQFFILTLLLFFEVHREALLKEMHIPTCIIESSFEGMVSLVLATNQVSFSDDDLPPKGKEHTLAMHIVVKCEDMIVARVLIDNGLALNVHSMAILEPLKLDMSLIKPSAMIIKAFDGMRREGQGEIELMIEIGSRSFMVNFQVIKVNSSIQHAFRETLVA